MNKIKTVKIKNEDGSISEESYNISIDARNVDMDNRKDLQQTIGNIDVDNDGNIAIQLKNTSNNLNELNVDIKKKVYYYNTIEDIKADNKLKNGDYVTTLGYYRKNDGGGANFIVSDTVDSSYFQIAFGHFYLNYIEAGDYINVLKYGVKNDGTDCIDILDSITNYYIDKNIYLPSGLYGISRTYYIVNNNNLELESNAEIRALDYMDFLVCYNKNDTLTTNSRYRYIRGGKFNGNFKVNIAIITLKACNLTLIEDCVLLNSLKYGFKGKANSNTSVGGTRLKHLYVQNYQPITNSYGIYIDTNDGNYCDIVVRNFETAFYSICGFFDRCHGWIENSSLLENSVFFESNAGLNNLSNCYADTYRISIKSNSSYVQVSNFMSLWNTDIYTAELIEQYPITIFQHNGGYFVVNGANIKNYNPIKVELVNNYSANDNMNGLVFSSTATANLDITNATSDKFDFVHGLPYSQNADITYEPGFYGTLANTANIPVAKRGYMIVVTVPGGNYRIIQNNVTDNISSILQIYYNYADNVIYFREFVNQTWSEWKQIS